MEFDRERLKSKESTMLLLMLFFAVSLLVPLIAHFYVMFVLPLVVSYFLAPNLAEVVFFTHRRTSFSKSLKSTKDYYRFLVSNISFAKVMEFSFYPFLFFISILLQTGEPSFGYLFEMKAFFTTLSFPLIFLLAAVAWLLDQSGLRYVDEKNQYIQRLGVWFSSRFRGFASVFVVISLVLRIMETGISMATAQEILEVSIIIYIHLRFALRRDLEKFENILSKGYNISTERVEFKLTKTRFFF
jgi:hypothetical protein